MRGSAKDLVRRGMKKAASELTDKHEAYLLKLEQVDSILKDFGNNHNALEQIKEQFGVDIRQARQLVMETMAQYSYEKRENKAYYKNYCIGVLSGFLARNKDSEDPKVMKVLVEAAKELRLATQFDVADEEVHNPEDLLQGPTFLTSDPEEAGLIKVEDADEKIKRFMERIEAEEIKDFIESNDVTGG